MKKDYYTVNELTYLQQRNYLMEVCQNQDIQFTLAKCMNKKKFMKLFEEQKKYFYQESLKALQESYNYESLEYHLIHMNSLFHYHSYKKIKESLFNKLTQKRVGLEEYCVLRQLIHFEKTSFEYFIKYLYDFCYVREEECAKICFLENQHHLAYEYLKQLDDCQNEVLLDLLCSYSMSEYVSLMKHYHRKQNQYVLSPIH